MFISESEQQTKPGRFERKKNKKSLQKLNKKNK